MVLPRWKANESEMRSTNLIYSHEIKLIKILFFFSIFWDLDLHFVIVVNSYKKNNGLKILSNLY